MSGKAPRTSPSIAKYVPPKIRSLFTSSPLSKPQQDPATEKGGYSGAISNDNSIDSSETAIDHLSARVPIPQYIIDYILTFHEQSSFGHPKDKWRAVLDLGCGPGQFAIHLSSRFRNVYGRDVSDKMIQMAKSLLHLDRQSLEEVGLPKPPEETTFDYAVSNEFELGMPDNSVDLIIIGSAAHCFDWSSEEAIKRTWTEWTRVLRKNGTLAVTGIIPVPGNWTGSEALKTRPLRHLMRNIAFEGELAQYYNRTQADIGTGSMYNCMPMPWTHCKEWNRESRLFMTFDTPNDVSSLGHATPNSDAIPGWIPARLQRYISTTEGPGDGYSQVCKRWNTTTARRLAVWLRSSSGYIQHLKHHPEDRLLIGRDDDLAARMIKKACREGHLDYDETIELHHACSVLALRKCG